MIDVVDVAAERIRGAGYSGVAVQRLADVEAGGIAVRRLPSATTSRYLDGPRAIAYVFQVVVVRESERQAINECYGIASTLPHLNLDSANGTYSMTSCDVYTEPQEIDIEGKNSAWECRFRAIITTNERT